MKEQNQSDRCGGDRFNKNLNSQANSIPPLPHCLDSLLDIPWSPEASLAIDKWLCWLALEFEGGEVMSRPNHINQKHWDELMASAISSEIASLNFWTVEDPGQVDKLLNRNRDRKWKHSVDLVPGWAVAGVDPETGERNYLGVQYKPDNPRPETDEKGNPKYNRDGSIKYRKYLSATDYPAEPLTLDTGDSGYWQRVLSDRLALVLITEGAKKSASGLSYGYATVAITGVTTGQKLGRLKPKLERFCCVGRTVYLCFDNDLMSNHNVCQALNTLGRLIEACGAVVKVILLPEGEAKGLDDYLAVYGRDAFQEVLENSRTFAEWRSELNQAPSADSDDFDEKPEKKSQSTLLVELAITLGIELFHNLEGDGYADIHSDGPRATYKLRNKDFKDWLNRQFYLKHGKTANSQAMQDALNVLDGMARYEGVERPVYVRLAEHEGNIYLDLGTDDWSAISITSEGWQVDPEPTVRFRRPKGLLPLPVPERGSPVSVLLEVLNIRLDDWPLIAAWLLFCFNPTNPKPILMLSGEHGSAKSSVARLLRRLTDPNKADLRQEPKDGRDLMIAASNGWVLAYDNLSRVPNNLSDALCRLATGGGFATRQLYENDEETILEATRPVILTGIEELASRSDLLDRMVLINLPTISEVDRQPESELEPELERLRPLVLGALLTAVAATLKKLPKVKPESLPRMADFAKWGIAGEAALGLEPGSFIRAYQGNRERANETALDATPVAQAIQKLMEDQTPCEATANELLATLCSQVDEQTKRGKAWPQTPKGLSSVLRRLAPNLRAIGIDVTFDDKRTNRGRLIHLDKLDRAGKEPSQPSQPSQEFSKPACGAEHNPVTVQPKTVTVQNPTVTTVTQPSLNRHKLEASLGKGFGECSDGSVHCDGSNPTQSNGHRREFWNGFKVGDRVRYVGSVLSRLAGDKPLAVMSVSEGLVKVKADDWLVTQSVPVQDLRLAA